MQQIHRKFRPSSAQTSSGITGLQQGRFPAPGRPQHRDEFVPSDLEAQARGYFHRAARVSVHPPMGASSYNSVMQRASTGPKANTFIFIFAASVHF